jgi:sigma-B regulation protein RsbU (phosphoserine phosphatase)
MASDGHVDVHQRLRDSEQQLRTIEEELRVHAARLDEAQAIAHLGSWEWDVQRDTVTWSDEMHRIYGLEPTRAPVDFAHFLDYVHPDDRERVDQAVQQALAAGAEFTFEHRIVRSDGAERIVQARGRAIADEDGTVIRMAGTGHDVTEQRTAQDQAATASAAIAMAQRVADLQLITETALAHLGLDDLLPELLDRICQALRVEDAAVLLMDGDGETLVLEAARGSSQAEVGTRMAVGGGFTGRVAHERKTLVIQGDAFDQVLSPALNETRLNAVVGVPLLLRGELLGVLNVGALHDREFAEDEVALIELAAERAAMAIDHARVYERERKIAETLQRALLPEKLPELDAVRAAVRYVPASDVAEIGGDWYDVMALPGGDVGIVLGDVTGHGLEAAALMAQLRHGLRAYALDGLEPAAIAQRLDTLIHTPGFERLATLVYAILSPDLTLRYVNAGHLPPLIASADGSTRLLDDPGGVPIGCETSLYATQYAQLEPGDALVLYTDGLVERRGESIDDGIGRLRDVASAGVTDPHDLADAILRALLPVTDGEDDIAVLVVRPEPDARPPA